MYQSHPWVLAVLPNGEALGILADTTRRCEVLRISILCDMLKFNLLKDLLLGSLPIHLFSIQIDLQKESIVKFSASSSYPIITFGPFASPTAVLTSLSHAIGNFLMHFKCFFVPVQYALSECFYLTMWGPKFQALRKIFEVHCQTSLSI